MGRRSACAIRRQNGLLTVRVGGGTLRDGRVEVGRRALTCVGVAVVVCVSVGRGRIETELAGVSGCVGAGVGVFWGSNECCCCSVCGCRRGRPRPRVGWVAIVSIIIMCYDR